MIETAIETSGAITLAAEWVIAVYGDPAGQTFIFEHKRDGRIYTYAGVTCVVDGAAAHFQIDDSMLVRSRRAASEDAVVSIAKDT